MSLGGEGGMGVLGGGYISFGGRELVIMGYSVLGDGWGVRFRNGFFFEGFRCFVRDVLFWSLF